GEDGDIVQAQIAAAALGPLDDALEHQVAGDAVIAPDDLGEDGPQLVRAEVGEEPELAEVDAEDGRLPVAHLPGRPQGGAAAAEQQRDVGRVGAEVLDLEQVVDDDPAVLDEERHQPIGLLPHARTVRVTQKKDSHGSLTTTGTNHAPSPYLGSGAGRPPAADS